MTYRFIYSNADRARLIPAVIIDKRAAIPAIAGAVGTVIKQYTDAAVALVDEPRFLTYKIETTNGNVAGYFVIGVKSSGVGLGALQLRPAFESQNAVISGFIDNFILSGDWKADALL